ncbi:hypothetical protein MKW94_001906 [Papaver nudicaule]|uniref:Uncharacterized protein n=1 Tax=Papaver nudicaule TaxID=74823 RepID=A0AA41V073_PAPNU|nr:hypothetical protein [Papaver nudicaule]
MNLCKSFAVNLSSSRSTVRRLSILLQSSNLSSSSPEPEPELLVSESNHNQEFSRFKIDPNLPPQRYTGSLDWPKPSKIPWQSHKTNSINLIGSVSRPVQFQGESTVIAILSHGSATGLRIPIIFKGYLADIAAEHLKEKDMIHVAGHLTGDSLPSEFVKEYGHFGIQVTVHSISFIKESSQGRQTHTTYTQAQQASGQSVSTLKDNPWKNLFDHPSQWADYRKDKLNGLLTMKAPDLIHKDAREAPWLDSSPTRVLEKLPPASKPKGEPEESWKNLIKNPDKWVDIRSEKINEKEPDFLHKDTGNALWLSNAPTWLLEKLPPAK